MISKLITGDGTRSGQSCQIVLYPGRTESSLLENLKIEKNPMKGKNLVRITEFSSYTQSTIWHKVRELAFRFVVVLLAGKIATIQNN